MMAYVVTLPLLFAATLVSGQDDFGGGEDAGGGEDMMDMESMGIGSESGNNRGGQVKSEKWFPKISRADVGNYVVHPNTLLIRP